jgi:hypothetical protein
VKYSSRILRRTAFLPLISALAKFPKDRETESVVTPVCVFSWPTTTTFPSVCISTPEMPKLLLPIPSCRMK